MADRNLVDRPMHDALLPFRRYARFRGRARRRGFWLFTLLVFVVGIFATLLDVALSLGGSIMTVTSVEGHNYSSESELRGGLLDMLWFFATLVPHLAVSVRRLHDTGRSGWWLLLLLVPLFGWIALVVFMCLEGTPGPNRHGPSEKAPAGLTYL